VSALPAQFVHLVDDAAIFPPGNLPLEQAVEEHEDHLRSEYAGLLGGFVVSDVKLPDLVELLPPGAGLGVHLVVTGGAGAIEGAVRWADRADQVGLEALEFALRDEDDLAHNARRVLAMLDTLDAELADTEVYVEPPRVRDRPTAGWLGALDVLAERDMPLKFRTGGVREDDYPTSAELAACIDAALDRELPFKCTAGLHHAVRDGHRHGFLNVLVATTAALDGNDVVAALEETDVEPLVELVRREGERTRRWFRSFGSCSVLEPHDDLVELGLVPTAP
jgi:hypothetical protein